MAEIMMWEAILRAHDEELANDPLVIAMGEDIGVVGGTYKATLGLYDKYGEKRIIDTPISENGYTGLGIGASFVGVRPIIEIMSVNFAASGAPGSRHGSAPAVAARGSRSSGTTRSF